MADHTIARTFNVGEELGKNPAFPCDGSRQSSGLSIRDYFAAAVTPACVREFLVAGDAWTDHTDLARTIYSIADALVQERVK